MGIINAPNRVVDNQKYYQAAYAQHQRLWKIGPRANYMLVPYHILLWGTFGCTMYMMGRKIAGYNTWFGSK